MEDTLGFLIPSALMLGTLLFLYTFRSAATDVLYLSIKRWHHTLFIAVCLCAGVFFGAYNSHFGNLIDTRDFHLKLYTGKKTEDRYLAETIGTCKKFVEAKLDGRHDYDTPPPSPGILHIGAPSSYWDTCARAFGMTYWKHDIFIRGQEAGTLLCQAYRADSYRSGNVESWCSTVLASGKKI